VRSITETPLESSIISLFPVYILTVLKLPVKANPHGIARDGDTLYLRMAVGNRKLVHGHYTFALLRSLILPHSLWWLQLISCSQKI